MHKLNQFFSRFPGVNRLSQLNSPAFRSEHSLNTPYLYSFTKPGMSQSRKNFVTGGIPLLLGAVLGLLTSLLVVENEWPLILVLLLALPAFILIHHYPYITVFIWLLAAPFLMLTPTMSGRMLYWGIHRALPPVTLIIMVLASVLKVNPRRLPKLGLPEIAMTGYVIASIVSIYTQNNNPQHFIIILYDRVISPISLYLIVRLSAPKEIDFRRLIPVALFLGASQSIIGLISWIAPSALPGVWLTKEGERLSGSLVNPSVYTATLIFAGLYLLQAAIIQKKGFIRNIYILVLLLCFVCVFFSFSRASWLGGILVFLGLFYLYPKFLIRLSLIMSPVVVLLLSRGLFSNELQFASQRLYSAESEQTALSRLPVFLAAYRMFQEKPYFGWGYGNFDRFDRQFQGRVAELVSPSKDHASHNVYLSIIAEQGLLGLSLYLLPLIYWFIYSMRVLPRLPTGGFLSRQWLALLWLVILNFIVLNNFSNLIVVFGLGLWWITLGLIATVAKSYASYQPDA
jgi:O-antigen ligase